MASALIVIQMLGLFFSASLAVYDIETIVATGPIFSLTSAAIVVLSLQAQRPAGFYFGLAAPTIAVACFCIICGLEWGPSRAQVPISWLLVGFAAGCIPAGVHAFAETRSDPPASRRPFQFGIAAMLWLTLIVALLLSLLRLQNQQRIAFVASTAYVLAVGYLVRQFHRDRLADPISGRETAKGNAEGDPPQADASLPRAKT